MAMRIYFFILLFPVLVFSQECKVTQDELKELQKISNCARATSYRECSVKSGSGLDGNTLGGTQGLYLGVYATVETSDELKKERPKKKKEVALLEWVWSFAFAVELDHNKYLTDEVDKLATDTDTALNDKIRDTKVNITRLEQTAFNIRVETVEASRVSAVREFIKKNPGRQGVSMLESYLEDLEKVPLKDVEDRNELWRQTSSRAESYFGGDAKDLRQVLQSPSYHLSKPDVANDMAFLREQGTKFQGAAKGEALEVAQAHETLNRYLPVLKQEAEVNSTFMAKNHRKTLSIYTDDGRVRSWLENVVANHENPKSPSNSFQRVYATVTPESPVKVDARSQRFIQAGIKVAEDEGRLVPESQRTAATDVAKKGMKKFGLKAVGYATMGPVGAALAMKDNIALAHDIVSGELSCQSFNTDSGHYTPYKRENNGESCVTVPDIKHQGYNHFLNQDYKIQQLALMRKPDLCKVTQEMAIKYNPTDWLLTCTREGFEAKNEKMNVKSTVRIDAKTGLPSTVTLEGDEDYIENGQAGYLMDKGEVESICVPKTGLMSGLVRRAENSFKGNLFCHPGANHEVKYDAAMASESLFAKEKRSESDDEGRMKKIGDQSIQFFQVHSFAFNEMAQCCSKSSTTYSGDRCNEYMKKGMKAQLRSEPNPSGSKKSR